MTATPSREALADMVARYSDDIDRTARTLRRRYKWCRIPWDDVRQAVVIGFIRAFQRYDESKGDFPPFAWHWARRCVQVECQFWAGHGFTNLPRNGQQHAIAVGPRPASADATRGVAESSILHALSDGAERNGPPPVDSPADFWSQVASYTSPIEFDLLKRRSAGQSLREIADAVGVSHQRIAQIETRATQKLRRRKLLHNLWMAL